MAAAPNRPATEAELQDLVAAADTGGRRASGMAGTVLLAVAVAWSTFQVWYASPLPFVLGIFILNDTEARAIHLAFAVFLAFTAFPALRSSPRDRVPAIDWVLSVVAAFCAAYLFLFYVSLSTRPGQPTAFDLVTGGVGLLLLLEATRRSLGPPLVIVALVFMGFTFAGPWMPEVIQHKGASITKFLSHQWLTTEGVFGVALGVSTSFVFLFVLFGSLLEKAGAGNYMMQISFALLGHLRGGPAKVAVVSSALNGIISGSSISNVVSGGIFTIPMMKRTGLSGVKAGAIETASSINGQLMPPVMGAAAFLMVEYVGIPYSEIVKHAILPAIICYVALFYIVHIEALKLDLPVLKRPVERAPMERVIALGLGTAGTVVVCCAIYYLIAFVQAALGATANWVIGAGVIVAYLALLGYAARFPDLELDDPNSPVVRLPETWPTVRTGIHFLIPIFVLIWCLMVEQMSPGLSAFWATATTMGIIVTQRPIIAAFRRQGAIGAEILRGIAELVESFNLGARNMVAIGVATATAGIVVGTVTLTGMGLMMTEFVELMSGGDVFLMLVFIALISLILGMGIPTTANYILIATLLAPVVVELGAQGGLAVPLIAVHMFVFYFGIMADVTPPVGLAAFAAAAISGDDPIKTGFQGAIYSLRTALLPFLFVYSPQLLLIDVHSWLELVLVVFGATVAMMLFAAATMGFFIARSRVWESALLLLAAFTLFRPDWWMDRLTDRFVDRPAREIVALAESLPEDGRLLIVVEGTDIEGDDYRKTISLPMGDRAPGRDRLAAAGAQFVVAGDSVTVGVVRFGSPARRIGLETGATVTGIKLPADRPSPYWFYIPTLALAGLIALMQRARRDRGRRPVAVVAT